MGKGNRVRTQNADERKLKKEAAEKKAAKDRLYSRLTTAVAVVLVIALAFGFIWAAFLGSFVGSMRVHNAKTLKTENYEISAADFNYLYMTSYMNYLGQVGQYASQLGLNTEQPLKDQAYTGSGVDGYTWHDNFVDMTESAARELLVLCEEAKTRGITLGDEETKYIDESIESLKKTADESNMSFEKFLESYYGDYVTEKDVRKCMEMQSLAGLAAEAMENDADTSDAKLEEELKNNMSKYYFADYRFIEIKADYVTGAAEDVIAKAKEEAKAKADAILSASTDVETFKAAVEKYYSEQYEIIEDDKKTEDTDSTKTLTKSELKTKVDATLKSAYTYPAKGSETDLSKWVFEQGEDGAYIRKAGDAKLIEDASNGKYTVYVIEKPMYKNDYKLRDVRHILISVKSESVTDGLSDADAKAKADEILKQWQEGEKTAESFGKLATENTMDTGSKENGGLYEDVAKGDMVTEFNDWLFDEARKVGDTDIVKTEYGYHIMYYVGEAENVKWQEDAKTNIKSAYYEDQLKAITEKYAVTLDEKALKKVKQPGT